MPNATGWNPPDLCPHGVLGRCLCCMEGCDPEVHSIAQFFAIGARRESECPVCGRRMGSHMRIVKIHLQMGVQEDDVWVHDVCAMDVVHDGESHRQWLVPQPPPPPKARLF